MDTATGFSHQEAEDAVNAILQKEGRTREWLNEKILTEFLEESYQETLKSIRGMSIIFLLVGFWGVFSTLSLAVFERKREIGILRALCFNQRQIRTVIVAEAVIIAALGIAIGSGLGIFFAWGIYELIGLTELNTIISTDVFSIPLTQLLIYLTGGLILAVIAGLWPAYKVSKLDIVRAIDSR